MNEAVVVFLNSDSLVNELTVSGIWVKETFVPVTPLSAPSTTILKELQRFSKIASAVKTIPLGCENAALKHVLSFRRQVYMFLNSSERTLEVSFRVIHGENSFMVYASTDSMKCFDCGELGHKHFACPHKDKSESESEELYCQVCLHTQGIFFGVGSFYGPNIPCCGFNTGDVEIPGCSTAIEEDVNESDEADENEVQNNVDDVCADSGVEKTGGSQENMVDEMEDLSQYTDDGLRNDDEQCDHFPDIEKFVSSVMVARKKSNNTELLQQKRFHLKKHLTIIRSGRKMVKAKGKTK
ncbi:hypothetical protein IRJ41_016676 [Triplophysa rosa]|uniref:CCHC-type domain-containing protein n=1 Tax=Triplophysa rosa TaxID=992332 RepID=A0A9W8CBE3_TRIRA|nr:hypothetical protein IRJ41_016676 [Triplophysa rosa]